MKARFSFLVLGLFLSGHAASAAPLTRDLGLGLTYHRAAALPADLPTTEAGRKQPCVLDLRYAQGDATAGAALQAWLKFRAAPRTPVLLLVNAETAAPLLAAVGPQLAAAGVVTIGSGSSGPTPDLTVKTVPADERRAYDALAAGSPVELLLNDAPEKTRNDEARLAQDHHGAPPDPGSVSDDALDDLKPTVEKGPPKPAPLIDAALQRAVQLHRSLKALKKV